MMELTRRGFFGALLATGVSAGIAGRAATALERVASTHVWIRGAETVGVDDAGDGWYRVWGVFFGKIPDRIEVGPFASYVSAPNQDQAYTLSFYMKNVAGDRPDIRTGAVVTETGDAHVWGVQIERDRGPSMGRENLVLNSQR